MRAGETLVTKRGLRRFFIVAAALVPALASSSARAAGSCTIVTWSGVAFGTYDVMSSSPLDSTGAVLINCDNAATSVTVNLSRGNASTFKTRYLVNGSAHLSYNLFLDAARTTLWGDGTGGSSHYGPVSRPGLALLTIYGRIPALQDLPAGSYIDTIVATVNF